MADMIIYGKATCPHTTRARDAYKDATFVDVVANPDRLEEMLALSEGVRKVPVIVEGETVTIGYNRGA